MKSFITTITTDETYELAKLAAKGVCEYVFTHSIPIEESITGIIQGTLDGFISARSDNAKSERGNKKGENDRQ